jgi:hypothetical protein
VRQEGRQRSRHRALRRHLVDVAVVLVLAGHVVAFGVVRAGLHRHDGVAATFATAVSTVGGSRVGWPVDRREAVPALLEAGLTPVLLDPERSPPQHLAVNEVAFAAVPAGDTSLDDVTTDRWPLGSLDVRRIDLARAAATPILQGEEVGEELSRPYRYAPVRDSAEVTVDAPFVRSLELAPGRYRLSVDGFDPERGAQALVVRAGAEVLARSGGPLAPVAGAPLGGDFEVSGGAVRTVRIEVRPVPAGSDGRVLVHGWRVERRS